MKICKRLILVLCFLLGECALTWGGGIESIGTGSRAITLGGAYIGLANDYTAIFWNPAGLGQLEGSGIGFDAAVFNFTNDDGDSVRNFEPSNFTAQNVRQGDVFPRIHFTEPAHFEESKATTSPSPINPSFGGYKSLGNGWVIGGGVYVPLGNFVDWDDEIIDPSTQARISADYFSSIAIIHSNLSISKRLTDKLYLGGGFNFIYTLLEADAEKHYVGSNDLAYPDYNYKLDTNSSGWGLEWIIGILYKPSSRMSFGAVYRSGSNLKMEGDTKLINTAYGIWERRRFDQRFLRPPSYGLGIAYWITPKWLLTLDWQQTDWTDLKIDMDYENTGVLSDIAVSLGWDRSDRYRFGIEYQLTDSWALRFGHNWDRNSIPEEDNSMTNLIDARFQRTTAGFGYKHKSWSLDFFYMRVWGRIDGEEVTHGLVANNFGFSFTYEFF